MIKIVIFVAFIVGVIVIAPIAYGKYTVWDAAEPKDDESLINKVLVPFTPSVGITKLKSEMELYPGSIIVDVRTKEEYDEAHIPDALLVPEQELILEIPQTISDKYKRIFLYGNVGQNSAVSTRLLRYLGFENAFNIEGGLENWKKSGNRIESIYTYPE